MAFVNTTCMTCGAYVSVTSNRCPLCTGHVWHTEDILRQMAIEEALRPDKPKRSMKSRLLSGG